MCHETARTRLISSYEQNANFRQFLLMCISLTNEIFQTLPVTRSRPFSCWRMLSTGDVLLCLARSTVLPRRQVRLREYSAHLSLISFHLKTKDKPAMHLKERNACYLDEGFHWNDMLLQVIADERKGGLDVWEGGKSRVFFFTVSFCASKVLFPYFERYYLVLLHCSWNFSLLRSPTLSQKI